MTDQLTTTAIDIERHVADGGWDQPPRLYALVATTDLIREEPALAAQLGLDAASTPADSLTPVEQEDLPEGSLDEALAGIAWPDSVSGCALVHEAVVLPPGAEDDAPAGDETTLAEWAAAHPDRRDVRLAVAVLRDGSVAAALRIRGDGGEDAEDAEAGDELVTGADLAPNLAAALLATLA